MSNRAKWIGRLIFWPVFGLLVFLVARNPTGFRYELLDRWRLLGYNAPADISQIAQQITLTKHGRDIFYASHPEVDDKQTFNQGCQFQEKTLVLGCYGHERIYILDIQIPDLGAVEPVTAAHEMLHAAWARMSDKERSPVGKLVNDEFAHTKDQHLKELIQEYKDSGDDQPDVITNELHSILATEVATLSPELESYYKQYFTDRSKIVELFDSYEAVFKQYERSIEGLRDELSQLYRSIQTQQRSLELKKTTIDSNNARLKQLASSGDAQAYNSLLSTQRRLISQYNAMVASYNKDVKAYQAKVEDYKSAALRYDGLIQAIDSKAPETL